MSCIWPFTNLEYGGFFEASPLWHRRGVGSDVFRRQIEGEFTVAKMMAYDEEARQKLASGVSKLARAVRSTLGPRGRNAVIDKGLGQPDRHQGRRDRGRGDRADRPYENMGAQLVKEAASKTSDAAGDGTTTATVLAEAIFKEGLKALAAGADAMALKRGIDKAVLAVVEHVKGQSKTVGDKESPRSPPSPPTTTRPSARSSPTPSSGSARTA